MWKLSAFFHKILSTIYLWMFLFSKLSTFYIVCGIFILPTILHIVEHKSFYFKFSENFKPFLPHCECLHCNFHNVELLYCTFHIAENITRWKLSACLPQNYLNYLTVAIPIVNHLEHFFHIPKLSLQFCGDFHKSFHNLPNFFREHARGARAIFHL